MSDVMFLMSQLLAPEPINPWEDGFDQPPLSTQAAPLTAVAIAEPAQPQIIGDLLTPNFASVGSTTPSTNTSKALPETVLPSVTPPEVLSLIPRVSTSRVDDLRSGVSRPLASEQVAALRQRLLTPEPVSNASHRRENPVPPTFTDNQTPATPLPAMNFPSADLPAVPLPNAQSPQLTARLAPTSTTLNPILSYTASENMVSMAMARVTPTFGPRPGSGPQLYTQRQLALQSGRLYTRIRPDSYYAQWVNASAQPTYENWKALLAQEANAVATGQGDNPLTVMVGDSLSLWLPPDMLPSDRLWLNQGISGDTTRGVLNRLSAFANTRPDKIYVMAGINDLKNGATDAEVLVNLEQIMRQLRQQHPQAQIVVNSILPTRWASISCDRINHLNQQIAQLAGKTGVSYLDLQPGFADETGNLRPELTTDGLHLNRLGYQVWQLALLSI
jgi:lysophospholipase L1-like esterase